MAQEIPLHDYPPEQSPEETNETIQSEKSSDQQLESNWSWSFQSCKRLVCQLWPWTQGIQEEDEDENQKRCATIGAFLANLMNRPGNGPSVMQDVFEGYIAYVEEILTSKVTVIDDSDIVPIWKLLRDDFLELFDYFKIEQKEAFMGHLNEMQVWEQIRLSSLIEKMYLLRTIDEEGREDRLKIFLKQHTENVGDFCNILEDLEKLGNDVIKFFEKDECRDHDFKSILEKLKSHQKMYRFEEADYIVENITKRSLGKMIIFHVGNEGVDSRPELRRLIQACIDHLSKEEKNVWKNASFTIYDDSGIFKISSGSKKYKFICEMEEGQPVVQKEACFLKDKFVNVQ